MIESIGQSHGFKMAMLAEQRRKKKMSVDPRGSNWTNG